MSEDDEEQERDPFGRLEDAAADRDGDPFEHLSAPDTDEGAGSAPTVDPGDEADDEDSGSEPTGPTTAGDADAVQPGMPSVDAPDPEDRTGDPFTSPDSAFERMDVGDLDEDEVWEAIADAEARGSVADAAERTYAEVSKHRFCETCPHFTDPPAIACTHEGTEILEFLDLETVRVVDCPIVEERRELRREGQSEA